MFSGYLNALESENKMLSAALGKYEQKLSAARYEIRKLQDVEQSCTLAIEFLRSQLNRSFDQIGVISRLEEWGQK